MSRKIIGATVGTSISPEALKEKLNIIPGSGGNVDLTGYATEEWVQEGYQPKGAYLTEVPEGYAKTEDIPTKPEDIGAQPAGNYALKTEIPSVPVQSVNGKTGAVQLGAADVGARSDSWMPTAQEVGALPNTYTPPNQTPEQVGADPKGTAASAVSQHNTADDSHNDIRLELKAISDRLTAFFDSDDQTLDELSEIVAYITSNKSLIDSITTSKVSVADIINNLTTNVSNKPLSAAQGVVLKGLIDTVSGNLANYQPKGDYALRSELPTIPTKVSAFTNDAGYLTEHQDISGKLDADKLPEAINDALAQAMASGAFDGEDGQGGYTPQKGVDYWTESDKAEMIAAAESHFEENCKGDIVQAIIAELQGLPVFGVVDENKVITVTSALSDGVYTLKYENEDGSFSEIGTVTVGNGGQNVLVNLADPTSAEWKTNKRINSSGNEVTVTLSDKTMIMTNLIDITGATNNTEFHIKGLDLLEVKVTSGYNRVYFYDENKSYKIYWQPSGNYVSNYLNVSDYSDSVQIFANVRQLISGISELSSVTVKYISFGAVLTGTAEDVVITKDMQIPVEG